MRDQLFEEVFFFGGGIYTLLQDWTQPDIHPVSQPPPIIHNPLRFHAAHYCLLPLEKTREKGSTGERQIERSWSKENLAYEKNFFYILFFKLNPTFFFWLIIGGKFWWNFPKLSNSIFCIVRSLADCGTKGSGWGRIEI